MDEKETAPRSEPPASGNGGQNGDADDRVRTLEELLEQSRAREYGLTAQVVSDRATIADLESRYAADLARTMARAEEAQVARRAAETQIGDSQRRVELLTAELRARVAESESLRARIAVFERDLDRVQNEAAGLAEARALAALLKRERDEARERAFTERRLAAQDRTLAAEAELRAVSLQGQVQAAQAMIEQLMRAAGVTAPTTEAETPTVIDLTEGAPLEGQMKLGGDPTNDEAPAEDAPAEDADHPTGLRRLAGLVRGHRRDTESTTPSSW